jgi:uncharacterized Zn finger protein
MTSLRQIKCPKCDDLDVSTERLEKNNHTLNVKAKFTCKQCGHVWEGPVTNPDRRSILGFGW